LITDGAMFDAVSDLTDELQRVRQMLAAVCGKLGIDANEAQRLPGETAPGRRPWPPAAPGKHPDRM
jgi:hypothetical protein